MAVVYLAENQDFGRLVALKVLRPDRKLDEEIAVRFRSEAIAIAQLRHPHIIGIHSRGEEDGLMWFEMDYVDGGSLEGRLQAGAMEWAHVARLLAQAADGLQYAHTQGIIHRDIKPSNLLLSPNAEHLTITDFGIAKIVGRTTLTETGVTLGTVAYMSPEQLVADRELTGATDQYSLGIVAYEALAACRPFAGETSGQARFTRMSSSPPSLLALRPECPADLQALIERMLANDPLLRWPDLQVVKRAAEEIALIGEAPSLRGIPSRRPVRRTRSRVVISGAVIALVAGAGGWYATHLPTPITPMQPAGTTNGAATAPQTAAVVTPPPASVSPPPAVTTPSPAPTKRSPAVTPRVAAREVTDGSPQEGAELRQGGAEPDRTVGDFTAITPPPPPPTTATLRIASPLPGTFVNINGASTPLQLREQFQDFEVTAGEIRLLIRQEGCRDRADVLTLKPGEVRAIRRTANCPNN